MAVTIGEVLAARRAHGRLLRLYREPDMQPTHWIGEAEDRTLWEWPAEHGGWSRRHPCSGGRERLQEVEPYNAAGTGWPGLTMPDGVA